MSELANTSQWVVYAVLRFLHVSAYRRIAFIDEYLWFAALTCMLARLHTKTAFVHAMALDFGHIMNCPYCVYTLRTWSLDNWRTDLPNNENIQSERIWCDQKTVILAKPSKQTQTICAYAWSHRHQSAEHHASVVWEARYAVFRSVGVHKNTAATPHVCSGHACLQCVQHLYVESTYIV